MSLYLTKASDDVISFCTCADGRVALPSQMDCPWCGCGWLFSCLTCRKAFTFAKAVEIDQTLEQLAIADLEKRWARPPTDEEMQLWVGAMVDMLADVEIGEEYVVVDWNLFSVKSRNVEFDGLYAHHRFDRLPQVKALQDTAALDSQLGNRDYWIANALSGK